MQTIRNLHICKKNKGTFVWCLPEEKENQKIFQHSGPCRTNNFVLCIGLLGRGKVCMEYPSGNHIADKAGVIV